jgi:hypothetical protein
MTPLGLTTTCWLPLPGRVLKLGKTTKELAKVGVFLKNSRHASGHRERAQLTHNERVGLAAYSLGKGLDVPPDYPILGAFRRALLRGAHAALDDPTRFTFKKNPLDPDPMHGWTHVSTEGGTGVDLDVEEVLNLIHARYNITKAEVRSLEALFDSVVSLPAFVAHPACVKLLLVDYA